ncbi:cytochrome c oxidase assembly protein (plasmid) [Peteryoungia desertarenae]|uniref:Cytochrome c oxidase assembly protein n=1 Tax=Peteryoungia desertarenae TaxID=1813451 RepID=A0ABX6QT56_9HYPH|nr:cytochrome c oxidase assembly protein [Peteryoungia desertarenae]QLF71831.1 cytochrome c oxidase assembly protein [Peteryoungia desertarenae]
MGPLALHMATHTALMNGIAPITVIALRHLRIQARPAVSGALVTATALQLLLLWAWHAPPLLNEAMHSGATHLLMQASLFAAAFCFWDSVLACNQRWKPIVALLVTSKLFCLLGVLFVFSPSMLYLGLLGHVHGGEVMVGTTLADQQLAGLLMLATCPVTYVVGGILLANRWLTEIDCKGSREDSVLPTARIE